MIISHHMLSGLKEGQEKMSKSDPDSAIFMEDTAGDDDGDGAYGGSDDDDNGDDVMMMVVVMMKIMVI